MTETIGQRPWMIARETVAVMDALEAAGGADCARYVGGCVRNTLIGRPVSDIDIATTLNPEPVIKALRTAKLKAVPTGVEHGTVTAISGGKPYEITTLRRDVATDGRRAVVAFTDDWSQDARRRDFTLNALYAQRDGSLFDPTGHGVADARAGRIVFVGEAEARVREDYLRILRFFRFLAWYGAGPADAAALAACETLKGELKSLSAERVSKELLKLLAADDPREAVGLMARTGVLGEVLRAPIDLARFSGVVAIEEDQLFENDPVLRLAALLPDDQVGAVQLAERLRLSNAERDRIAAALAPTPDLQELDEPAGDPPHALSPGRRAVPRSGQTGLGQGRPHGHHATVARDDRAGGRLEPARLPSDRRGRHRRRRAQGPHGRPGAARGGGLVDRPRLHRRSDVDGREAEVGGPGDGVLAGVSLMMDHREWIRRATDIGLAR